MIYIKNSASRSDINIFKNFVSSYQESDKSNFVLTNITPKHLQVGDLQPQYAQFNLIYNQYRQVLNSSNTKSQIKTLYDEIARTNDLIVLQNREKEFFNQELLLKSKDRLRQEELNSEDLVSDVDFEASLIIETQLLRQGESMNKELVQNQIKLDQLKLQIDQLQESRTNQINEYQFQLENIINTFWEKYASWKLKHIISAEQAGIINYSKYLTEGQTINPNQTVAHLFDSGNGGNLIVVPVQSKGISELKRGAKAIIKIDAYPYKQYGVLIGSLDNISDVPLVQQNDQELYEATILLPEKLTTDHGQEVLVSPKMKVSVDFITENKSIFSRLFAPLVDMLTSH